MITVGYCAMGGGIYAAKQLRPLIESLGMKLSIITEWEEADIPWNKDTYIQELSNFDILICPIDHFKFPFKGNNKLSQYMHLKKPVIASPLQSYKEIIKNGENGFIADKLEDWEKYLTLLRDNSELRKKIGDNAFNTVKEAFSTSTLSEKLYNSFKDVETTIDIIIPNYNNKKYLLKTLESLKENTKNKFIVHIVDSSTEDISDISNYLSNSGMTYTLKKFEERTCFSKQVNWGIENSSNGLVLIGNNDLLFTKYWDEPLVSFLKNNPNSMVGPLSNCDKYWLHNHKIITNKGTSLEPGVHSIDTFDFEDFYSSQDNFKKDENIQREKLAFFCTMFNRKLVSKIGILDPEYINGGEDFDYCYRAKKAGWSFYTIHNSFVFHFGGKTRKVNENENYNRHHEEDLFNNTRLKKKLGKSVLAFYLGAGWEKWDESNLISGGIGGSETAAIWMARELSKFGYQVKVFADPKTEHMDSSGDDVEYIHWSKWEKFAKTTFIDFLISSRTVAPFHNLIHAYKKYVWVHDVFINPDRNHNVFVNDVTNYLCLSEWHKNYLNYHHNIPLEKIHITANGIDETRYQKEVERNPSQIFYSSSPDRGLDTLLYCSDFIKEYVPNFKVVVAYGFNNWEKAVRFRNNPNEVQAMENLKKQLQKPYVEYVGRVDQNKLAEIQLQSSGWFYPTKFHETFCITATEAGWSGNPIIASKHAGIISTVKDGGLLLEGDAYSKEYRERFINECVDMLVNKNKNRDWGELSKERMKRFTWKAVALQWHRMFQEGVFTEIQ
jgi:glycosyltransferase involved in cell wall biosynthesis